MTNHLLVLRMIPSLIPCPVRDLLIKLGNGYLFCLEKARSVDGAGQEAKVARTLITFDAHWGYSVK
jgi:hypothetical protein